MTAVERLLAIASPALAPARPLPAPGRAGVSGTEAELAALLSERNGFYAFESALHVLSVQEQEAWNASATWRDAYDGMADGLLCFAEDVFGGQFAVDQSGRVVTFEPETGDVAGLADGIESWAAAVLDDGSLLTGYPHAHHWQAQHGALPPGQRLLPKLPFVAGGEFSVDNLYPLDALKGMRLRGELAVQIRDLPDGAKIRFTTES